MLIKKSFMRDSQNNSLTSSAVMHKAQGILMDEKKDNLIGLMDSILRRNRLDDDDDDVLIDADEPLADVVTDDVLDLGQTNFRKCKVDFLYNREDHQLTKLFFLIAEPEDEEKLPLVVLKIID